MTSWHAEIWIPPSQGANAKREPLLIAPRRSQANKLLQTSEIERSFIHCQSGFLGGFAQAGVSMADACDVFRRGFELHRDHGFGDQLRGLRANDVHAKDFIGGSIGLI